MDTKQAQSLGTATTAPSGAVKESIQDKVVPNVDKPAVETKHAASDEKAKNEFHSLTNGLTVKKLSMSDLVAIQVLGTPDVTILTKDQFDSSYGKVKKNLVLREAGTTKFAEGHELEDGSFIVHTRDVGQKTFKDKETLEKSYTISE